MEPRKQRRLKDPLSAGCFMPRVGASLFTTRSGMGLQGSVSKRLGYEPTLAGTV